MKNVLSRCGLFTAKESACSARWFVRYSRARRSFAIGPTHLPKPAAWVQRSSGLLLEPSSELRRQITARDIICVLVHFVTGLAILEFAARLDRLAGAVEHHVLPVAAVGIVTSLTFDHHREQFRRRALRRSEFLLNDDGPLRELRRLLFHHRVAAHVVDINGDVFVWTMRTARSGGGGQGRAKLRVLCEDQSRFRINARPVPVSGDQLGRGARSVERDSGARRWLIARA